MMKKIILLLLMTLVSSTTKGKPPEQQSFFLYLNDNNLIQGISTNSQTTFECTLNDPYFKWEGRSSTLKTTIDDTGIILEYKLDVVGPDWLYVTLKTDAQDIEITIKRSNNDWATGNAVAHQEYCGYNEFLESFDMEANLVKILMIRANINYHLLTLKEVKSLYFDDCQDTKNDIIDKLVKNLDNEDWNVRRKASLELSKKCNVIYLPQYLYYKNISLIQRSRIAQILQIYNFNMKDEVFIKLYNTVYLKEN